MANFGDMRESLRLLCMGGLGLVLSPDDVYGQLINRAHRDIVESYDWSFRLTNYVINSVPPKSQGLITLTTGSPSILGIGTNFTYSDVGSFIWPGGSGSTPLPVSDVQGAQLASLAHPYSGPSRVQTSYVCAPLYYLVEDALEVLDVVSEDWKLQKRLREEINDADPTRTDMGGAPSLFWCMAPPSPDGSVQIELWPVPADYRSYLVMYRCKAPRLVRDTDLPLVPGSLVEEKAAITACEMMAASTGQGSWLQIRELHHRNLYGDGNNNIGLLQEALTVDSRRQQYRPGVTNPGPVVDGSYDSVFTPDHAGGDADW